MDLWHMLQGEGEGVQQFYARQCNFTVPCTEDGDKIVKQVILFGLANVEIKKDVLGVSGINSKSLSETLGIIEDKEIAKSDLRLKGTAK